MSGPWGGDYSWSDPRYSDPNWVPPGWTQGGGPPAPPAPPPPMDLALPPVTPIVAPAPAPPPLAPGLPAGQQDAFDALQQTLAIYGLGTPEMLAWVKQQIIDGTGQSTIMFALYDPKTVPGKIVDQRFPELRQLREAAARGERHAMPLSIEQAVALHAQYEQIDSTAGISAYTSRELHSSAIGGGNSPAEYQHRVQLASDAVFSEPPEVRADLQRMFGVGEARGAAVMYFIDGEKALPLIEQQLTSAKVGGASRRAGFGLLTAEEAGRLALLGVDAGQTEQGFGQLAAQRELFGVLPGEAGSGIGREAQLGAAFEGNAADLQAIERKRAARKAAFMSGGALAASSAGVGGLGSAAS